MKKILLVDDEAAVIKLYMRWFETLLKKEAIPVLLTAASVDEAREKFLLNQEDIIAIVLDGNIIGPPAVEFSEDPSGTCPNSVVLVGEFRKTFKGPMIASSIVESSREILMEAGCDYKVDDKGKVVGKLIEILCL